MSGSGENVDHDLDADGGVNTSDDFVRFESSRHRRRPALVARMPRSGSGDLTGRPRTRR